MQTYGNPDVTYGFWAGNAMVTNRSGRFIGAHAAHTGMIAFGAGATTLVELAKFDPRGPDINAYIVFCSRHPHGPRW